MKLYYCWVFGRVSLAESSRSSPVNEPSCLCSVNGFRRFFLTAMLPEKVGAKIRIVSVSSRTVPNKASAFKLSCSSIADPVSIGVGILLFLICMYRRKDCVVPCYAWRNPSSRSVGMSFEPENSSAMRGAYDSGLMFSSFGLSTSILWY